MTGKARQIAQKTLSLGRIIRELGGAYITGFICLLCVAIGFTLGSMNTLDMAKDGIVQMQRATNAAILRKYGQ